MEKVTKKRGRPSRFRAEFAEKARTLAEFGATRGEIATFFGVDDETLEGGRPRTQPSPTRSRPARLEQMNASVVHLY